MLDNSDRPKRLLSLDGGGIRGVISAQVLVKIEDILKTYNPQLTCLADYFDFIGGTSTGSLLAAGLSKGMTARELLNLYVDRGTEIFKRSLLGHIPLLNQLGDKYTEKNLENLLKNEILVDQNKQPLLLGAAELKTYLMIVAKNATTDSTWFFVNHPNNKFFDTCSKIPLWQIARASSAAPTFFPPQRISMPTSNSGKIESYEFIDGGMSPYNNASFQLFLEATEPAYGIGWATGADKMLLISVGTGFGEDRIPLGKAKGYNSLQWAPYAIGTLMNGTNLQQNLLMQMVSSRSSKAAANGIPTILKQNISFSSPLVTYHRYTISFSKSRFERLGLGDIDVEAVKPMDCVDKIPELVRIGEAIAKEQVQPSDFEGFLDN
jgi:hypothetical protein